MGIPLVGRLRAKEKVMSPASSSVKRLPELASDVIQREPPKLSFPQLSPVSAPKEYPVSSPQPTFDEIREFEDAVQGFTGPVGELRRDASVSAPQRDLGQRFSYGFFNEVERRLKDQGHKLDVSGLMGKMKQFHVARSDGSPFYYSIADLQQAIDQGMTELKNLESRWLDAKSSLERAERDLVGHEKSISAKLQDVQELLRHSKVMEHLERRAPESQAFMLSTGSELHSLLELAVALRTMSDDTFASHVSSDRHDFAAWVRDVFGLQDLAMKLSSTMDRQAAVKVLTGYSP